MSVRNMLKVVMSLLLAMTIAATADAHAARVDQSPASVAAAGKLNDKIPYLVCIRICPGHCSCNKGPVELAQCTCSKSDSNKQAALLHTSEALQVKGKSVHSGRIPYPICIKICSNCACTKMWPPVINTCSCLDDSMPKKATTVADRLDQSLASVIEKAHELYEKLALLSGPVPKQTGGDDKKMVLWTKSKLEATIPYTECINTCELSICPLIYPPELAMCICAKPKSQPTSGKAVAK